jgi:hypothetical protein
LPLCYFKSTAAAIFSKSPNFERRHVGDPVEIRIAVEEKKVVLNGRLGDEAIDGAPD